MTYVGIPIWQRLERYSEGFENVNKEAIMKESVDIPCVSKIETDIYSLAVAVGRLFCSLNLWLCKCSHFDLFLPTCRVTQDCHDNASRFVQLLAPQGTNYLVEEDLEPLVQVGGVINVAYVGVAISGM